jgi:hypothetical protein
MSADGKSRSGLVKAVEALVHRGILGLVPAPAPRLSRDLTLASRAGRSDVVSSLRPIGTDGPNWDSTAHMRMMLALEDEFGIDLDETRMIEMPTDE